jgi:cellulose biosynthesis protein BcsQ
MDVLTLCRLKLKTWIRLYIFVKKSMALKIAFSNQKGGCGKSTATIMTATALSDQPFEYKVLVIDLDKQLSIFQQRQYDIEDKKSVNFDVIKFDQLNDFDNSIEHLDKDYDIILIDSGGKLDDNLPVEFQTITRVLSNIDILLIPFTSGNFSLESTIEYINFVNDFKRSSGLEFEMYGFINKFRNINSNVNLALDMAKISKAANIKMMRTRLKNYTLFESCDTSKTLYDENSNKADKLNFTVWLNELNNKILTS